jgi:C1A family cysteine protease
MTNAEVASAWPDFTVGVVADTSLLPVRDQGSRGTCLAFAMSAAHEHSRSPGETLSPEYLYWAAKHRDGRPTEDGTTIDAAAAALQHDGQPLEGAWPYDPSRSSKSHTYSPPAISASDLYRKTSTTPAISLAVLTAALSAGKLPIVALAVTTNFFLPVNGQVDPSISRVEGYHAVLAIAIGQQPVHGASVIIRNSWSDTWGIRGHALVPVAYFTNYLVGLIVLD